MREKYLALAKHCREIAKGTEASGDALAGSAVPFEP
jgi:hypothetical protein